MALLLYSKLRQFKLVAFSQERQMHDGEHVLPLPSPSPLQGHGAVGDGDTQHLQDAAERPKLREHSSRSPTRPSQVNMPPFQIYGVCCPYDQPQTRSSGKGPSYDVNFDFENKPVYDINYNFSLHPLSGDEDFPLESDFSYENYYVDGDEAPADYPNALGGGDRLSSGSDLMTKILNGRVARKNKYPFMAALMNRGQFFCGGSLITNRHVLTAAHCVAL